jgi:hypothetical protein
MSENISRCAISAFQAFQTCFVELSKVWRDGIHIKIAWLFTPLTPIQNLFHLKNKIIESMIQEETIIFDGNQY